MDAVFCAFDLLWLIPSSFHKVRKKNKEMLDQRSFFTVAD